MLKEIVSTDTISADQNCGGCGSIIKDRYYLVAADRAWHGACLRCCQCSQTLDSELSCFYRDGNIYCKEDYFRLFSSRRCDRCGAGLCSSELVMRARDLVFHINCFSCILCGAQLCAGDTAAIREGRLFCSEHYDNEVLSSESMTSFYAANNPQKGRPRKRKPVNQLAQQEHQQQQHQQQQQQQHQQSLQHQQQQSPLHHNTNNNNQSPSDMSRGTNTTLTTMDLNHTDLPLSSLDLSYDGSQSPGSNGNLSSSHSSRSKRMRTSFKHHQLRTMKSYFAINQNPDAKDLKQLAQKTGLSKRVLQVWFQNARAKWRRNVMRQEGGAGGGGGVGGVGGSNISGIAGGSIISNSGGGISSSNSNHLSGSLTSMNSGGPPSVQSSTSSNNMDSGMTPSHALEEMHHMTFAELY